MAGKTEQRLNSFRYEQLINLMLDFCTNKKRDNDKFNVRAKFLIEKLKQDIDFKDLYNVKIEGEYKNNSSVLKRSLDFAERHDASKLNDHITWKDQLLKIYNQLQQSRERLRFDEFIQQLQKIKSQLKLLKRNQLQYDNQNSSSGYSSLGQSDQFYYTSTQADASTSSNSNHGSSESGKTDRACNKGDSLKKENNTRKNLQLPADSTNGFSLKDDDKVFKNWCSIRYYEFNGQVGKTFHVRNNSSVVNVNNNKHKSNNTRFCLGTFTNVHRNETIEHVKKGIGSGIFLYQAMNGDIWLRQECAVSERVFVQSDYLTRENKKNINKPVHQICTHTYQKVFSLNSAHEQMKLNANNANSQSCKGLKSFKRFFSIRISFAEEWGPTCPRKTIQETACWIEVFFHSAIKLADTFLIK